LRIGEKPKGEQERAKETFIPFSLSSFLFLSFPSSKQGLHQFFWFYGLVFISSRNLNGTLNTVLCLSFLLFNLAQAQVPALKSTLPIWLVGGFFVYLIFPCFPKGFSSLEPIGLLCFLVPASALSFLLNNHLFINSATRNIY